MGESSSSAVLTSTDIPCPACGYDLRAALSGRCPECGTIIDPSIGSWIPWEHRRNVGLVRAYRRTLLLATFRIGRIAAEIDRPVGYRDARWFQLITVTLAWLPLAAFVIAGDCAGREARRFTLGMGAIPADLPRESIDLALPWIQSIGLHIVMPLAMFLFLLLTSGVASYAFPGRNVDRHRQDRGIALSYYACAPLAFLVIPVLVAAAAITLTWLIGHPIRIMIASGALGGTALLAIVILWWLNTIRLLRRATHGAGRTWLAVISLPVGWLATAIVSLGIVPWAAGFVALVVASLGR